MKLVKQKTDWLTGKEWDKYMRYGTVGYGTSSSVTTSSNMMTATITSDVTTYNQPQQDITVYRVQVPPGAHEVSFALSGEAMHRMMRQNVPAPLPPKTFNKFINASDMMEEFIRWCGEEGVKADELMGLPIDLFIKWLVVKACEQDGEEPNVELVIPKIDQPRCVSCKRFMRKEIEVPLHDYCAPRYYERCQARQQKKELV